MVPSLQHIIIELHYHSKYSASFIICITKIDGATIDDAEDLDLVMAMHSLKEPSSNHSEAKVSSWFYFKEKAANFNANVDNY